MLCFAAQLNDHNVSLFLWMQTGFADSRLQARVPRGHGVGAALERDLAERSPPSVPSVAPADHAAVGGGEAQMSTLEVQRVPRSGPDMVRRLLVASANSRRLRGHGPGVLGGGPASVAR